MKMHQAGAVLCLGLMSADPVQAQEQVDLDEIRQQMEQLRKDYEAQLKALEKRLEKAEAQAEQNRTELVEKETRPVAQQRASGGLGNSAFNPAISLVLQGSLNSYSKNPDSYSLPGFQLGGEAGLAAEGFTLDETELTASANVDQWFYAETTIALHDDEHDSEVEVEEAFAEPLMLPAGLGGRFGRFYSDVGYLNRFHTHTWDFHDAPLAYRAFLGKQYRDDGIRMNWTAPTSTYVMLGAETYAGREFPAGDETDKTLGDIQTAFLKLGGDIGASHAWQGGVSALIANVHDREGDGHSHDGNQAGSSFSGDSNLYMADLVYKWAPNGNRRQRNFTLQTEFFYREEDGGVTFTEDGNSALMDYDGDQKGWYAQAVYQFMSDWRVGTRYDWLNADNNLKVTNPGGLDPDEAIRESGFDSDSHDPQRWSLMVDWSPSEFSRIRAQYNHDESRPDKTDNQWSLQYIMGLGSHGAHEF